MNKEIPVLITGGSGYLASWIVKKFLEDGYTVHTSVRNLDDESKIVHLKKLSIENEKRLKLFQADLLEENSFAEAMQGCEIVIHTASPFFIDHIKDPLNELINPAVNGTKNVLNTVNQTESVKRVVLTSSVAAIYGDAKDVKNTENNIFTEEYWNITSSVKHNPYPYSKTLAEKTAWEMEKAQNRWTMSVINPGFIMGPSLTSRNDSTSIGFLIKLVDGTFSIGVPDLFFGVVDVRDVAEAHYQAAKIKVQERHILVADTIAVIDFCHILSDKFDGEYKFPRRTLPNWLLYIFGPLQGVTAKFVKNNMGVPMYFNNSKSKKNLKIKYRPINETLVDHFQQLINDQLISVKGK